MEIPILKDICIIFLLAIVIIFICHRLRIPTIIGFLLTGMFVGPYGLKLIGAVHEVELMAELGIVLLLFTIGMEFSFKRLSQLKSSILKGGSLQVLLTFFASFLIAREFTQTIGAAIFVGFLVALSSTAIVLKILQERAEVDSPHGRASLGILIFQDIIIVPMILVTPILAGASGNLGESLLVLLAKASGILVLVAVMAKWIVPRMLYHIARTRNPELFLMSVVLICLGIAWMTSKAGLSLALGAFLAGLSISESEYSHHALGNILPFRDVFAPFFFVSIGMMLNVFILFRELEIILPLTLGMLILKAFVAGCVTLLLGYPLRTGILVGFALSQVGEFSFILSRVGVEYGLLGERYQLFLAASILSMAATPFCIYLAPKLAELATRLPLPKRVIAGQGHFPITVVEDKNNHLIIIGFGINGRHVATAAKATRIPYLIIEMNPETVRKERAKGEPIVYGDATAEAMLKYAKIEAARVVVVAINDPTATRRIAELVKRLNRTVHLIVRTRYLQEMKPLYDLGADEVIPEEFETSIELFSRVLAKYLVPRDKIESLVAQVRADGYEMFRSISIEPASLCDMHLQLPDVEIAALEVPSESPVIGKSLASIELRKRHGVSVLAIRRNSETLTNPGGDAQICAHDVLIVLGPPEKLVEVSRLLNKGQSMGQT